MASRWVKAAFLALLGIVILLYVDRIVSDLRSAVEQHVTFVWIWDLFKVLLWILVAWLFVDAVLTVVLSFSDHRYSLADVMARLDAMESRMKAARPNEEPAGSGAAPVEPSTPAVTVGEPEEAPPPPGD